MTHYEPGIGLLGPVQVYSFPREDDCSRTSAQYNEAREPSRRHHHRRPSSPPRSQSSDEQCDRRAPAPECGGRRAGTGRGREVYRTNRGCKPTCYSKYRGCAKVERPQQPCERHKRLNYKSMRTRERPKAVLAYPLVNDDEMRSDDEFDLAQEFPVLRRGRESARKQTNRRPDKSGNVKRTKQAKDCNNFLIYTDGNKPIHVNKTDYNVIKQYGGIPPDVAAKKTPPKPSLWERFMRIRKGYVVEEEAKEEVDVVREEGSFNDAVFREEYVKEANRNRLAKSTGRDPTDYTKMYEQRVVYRDDPQAEGVYDSRDHEPREFHRPERVQEPRRYLNLVEPHYGQGMTYPIKPGFDERLVKVTPLAPTSCQDIPPEAVRTMNKLMAPEPAPIPQPIATGRPIQVMSSLQQIQSCFVNPPGEVVTPMKVDSVPKTVLVTTGVQTSSTRLFDKVVETPSWKSTPIASMTLTDETAKSSSYNSSKASHRRTSPKQSPGIFSKGSVNVSSKGSSDVSPKGSFNVAPKGSFNVSPKGSFNVSPKGSFNFSPKNSPKTSPRVSVDSIKNSVHQQVFRVQSGVSPKTSSAELKSKIAYSKKNTFVRCKCGERMRFTFALECDAEKEPLMGAQCAACYNRVRQDFVDLLEAYKEQGFELCTCKGAVSVSELADGYMKEQKVPCTCKTKGKTGSSKQQVNRPCHRPRETPVYRTESPTIASPVYTVAPCFEHPRPPKLPFDHYKYPSNYQKKEVYSCPITDTNYLKPDGYIYPTADTYLKPDGYKYPMLDTYMKPDGKKYSMPDTFQKSDGYKYPMPEVYQKMDTYCVPHTDTCKSCQQMFNCSPPRTFSYNQHKCIPLSRECSHINPNCEQPKRDWGFDPNYDYPRFYPAQYCCPTTSNSHAQRPPPRRLSSCSITRRPCRTHGMECPTSCSSPPLVSPSCDFSRSCKMKRGGPYYDTAEPCSWTRPDVTSCSADRFCTPRSATSHYEKVTAYPVPSAVRTTLPAEDDYHRPPGKERRCGTSEHRRPEVRFVEKDLVHPRSNTQQVYRMESHYDKQNDGHNSDHGEKRAVGKKEEKAREVTKEKKAIKPTEKRKLSNARENYWYY